MNVGLLCINRPFARLRYTYTHIRYTHTHTYADWGLYIEMVGIQKARILARLPQSQVREREREKGRGEREREREKERERERERRNHHTPTRNKTPILLRHTHTHRRRSRRGYEKANSTLCAIFLFTLHASSSSSLPMLRAYLSTVLMRLWRERERKHVCVSV